MFISISVLNLKRKAYKMPNIDLIYCNGNWGILGIFTLKFLFLLATNNFFYKEFSPFFVYIKIIILMPCSISNGI